MSSEINFFSVFPPTIGGVATFSVNLKSILKSKKFKIRSFDYSNDNYLKLILTTVILFFLFFKNSKKIISVSSIRHLLISCPGFFSGKTIVILHNALWSKNFYFKKIIYFLSFSKRFKFICVNKDVNDALVNNKLNSVFIPGYFSLKKNCFPIKSSKPIIAFTIWNLEEDLLYKIYGFKILKEIIHKISDLDFILKIYVGKVKNDRLLNLFYSLAKNVEIVIGKKYIENNKDVFILLRTNNIDGYGLVLAESIDLGIYTIATNVCKRPLGTFVFNGVNEINNVVDHIKKLLYIFPKKNEEKFDNCSSSVMLKTINNFFH